MKKLYTLLLLFISFFGFSQNDTIKNNAIFDWTNFVRFSNIIEIPNIATPPDSVFLILDANKRVAGLPLSSVQLSDAYIVNLINNTVTPYTDAQALAVVRDSVGLQNVTDVNPITNNAISIINYEELNTGTYTKLLVAGDTTSTLGQNPTIQIEIKGRNTQLLLGSSDATFGYVKGWELGLILGTANSGNITFRPNNIEVLHMSSSSGSLFRNTAQFENTNVLTFGQLRRLGDPLPGGTSGIRNTSASFTGGNMQFRIRMNNTWQTTAEIDSTGDWKWLYNWRDQSNIELSNEETLVSDGGGLNIRNINKVQDGITANRPSTPQTGQLYFDTTLSKLIVYNGTNWVNVDGTAL